MRVAARTTREDRHKVAVRAGHRCPAVRPWAAARLAVARRIHEGHHKAAGRARQHWDEQSRGVRLWAGSRQWAAGRAACTCHAARSAGVRWYRGGRSWAAGRGEHRCQHRAAGRAGRRCHVDHPWVESRPAAAAGRAGARVANPLAAAAHMCHVAHPWAAEDRMIPDGHSGAAGRVGHLCLGVHPSAVARLAAARDMCHGDHQSVESQRRAAGRGEQCRGVSGSAGAQLD